MAGRFRPRRRGLVALSSAAGLLAVGWLATTPWLVDHWPRVLAPALFLFVFVVPRLFVPARSAASLAGVEDPADRDRLEDDRLRLQNDVRLGGIYGLDVSVLARRTELAGDPPLDLSGSVLPQARLGWARLAGADLRGADLRGTSLQRADLVGVHLELALLRGTQLQGADLRGAHLAGSRASADTSWPDGFDRRAAGARLVDSC